MARMSAYDRYVTSEPEYDDRDPVTPPNCSACGGFLRFEPDRIEDVEDGVDCDGTVRVVHHEYGEGMAAILGTSPTATYPVDVSDCGIDRVPHEPHREVYFTGAALYRTCPKCGHENVEME